MFIASPQQWLFIYFMAMLIYLMTFSKISTTQTIASKSKTHAHKNFPWVW